MNQQAPQPHTDEQLRQALRDATDYVDTHGTDEAQRMLQAGHAIYYERLIEGREVLVKEYPNGRIEEIDTSGPLDEEVVLRVIRE